MKRLFFTLLFLFFIYFGIQTLFYFFGPGHTVNYDINDFEVKEEYTNNQKNEYQNYYFNISKDDLEISFQIFENFGNENKIIKEIKYYNDATITCILPIFQEDRILTGLICLMNDIVYPYDNIKGINANLDAFYETISDLLPKENLTNIDTKGNITLYKNNIPDNYYLSFATYKGYIRANSTKKELVSSNLFINDVYDNYLSAYINKYYVTVNYDEQYGFNNIYLYNILTGKEEKILLTTPIEKNSYIQGKYEDSVYIFDRTNKKQYEINTETKIVLEVGNADTGIKMLQNGEWDRISAYDCINDAVYFTEKTNNINEYKYLISNNGIKTGYSYYYKEEDGIYSVYRINNQNNKQFTYLFKTKSIDKVIAIDEYIFYLENNYIKYYSDFTGIRTLILNTELYFNQNIKYQIVNEK